MTLYELTNEYLSLLEMAEDPDCDPDIFEDTMEGLDGEIEDKADGYAKVIAELSSQTVPLKNEIDRLTARKRAIENNITRMKDHLKKAMIATGKTKFKTDLFSFGIQKNPPRLVMDEQYIENIPVRYLIEQEPKIDTAQLKADLKAGEYLEGIAHLEQDEGVRIR